MCTLCFPASRRTLVGLLSFYYHLFRSIPKNLLFLKISNLIGFGTAERTASKETATPTTTGRVEILQLQFIELASLYLFQPGSEDGEAPESLHLLGAHFRAAWEGGQLSSARGPSQL